MTQNAFHPKPSRKHGDQAALNNLSLGEEALNNWTHWLLYYT